MQLWAEIEVRKRRVAPGSRTVGRRSGRARGADGGQFSPAAKKGNFFFSLVATRLAGRRRNAAALTPVDGLVSRENFFFRAAS